MRNTQHFSPYDGVVTLVWTTSLTVAMGGCSLRNPPETLSPEPDKAVIAEQTAVTTHSANHSEAPVEQYRDIPKAFQGLWQATLEQCRSQGSETRLEIFPQRIKFYESQGPIQSVISDGRTTLKVTVELTGEGDTWLDEQEFQLSEDQNTLTAINDGGSLVRHRCS